MSKKNSIELLILCEFFYPDIGSTGKIITELAEDLVMQGMTVHVFCGSSSIILKKNANVFLKEEVYNGIYIRRFKYPVFNKDRKIGRLLNYFLYSFSVLVHLSYLRRYEKVLILSNPPILPYFGYLSKKLFKNKFIYLIHDLYPDNIVSIGAIKNKNIMVKIMNYINARVFKTADVIIVVGNEIKEYLKNKKKIIHDRIYSLSNWADKNNFISIKNKKSNDKFIIAYTGNIGWFQDFHLVIDCAKLLKTQKYNDIVFIFAGDGSHKKELKSVIVQNNLDNILFYDFLTGEDYNNLLQSADCYLLTIKNEAAGTAVPSKFYTYLAAGRPVLGIVSRDTDIGKLLDSDNIGYRIDQDDINTFYDKIFYLYNNRDICLEKGQRSCVVFEKLYERKILTKEYYKVLKSI